MSLPSIVSYGAAAKTSTLVWDGDLVIPDGYAIESASGEVGIVGDVSINGSLNTEGSISATGDLTGLNAVLSGKPLVIGENVGNASVTLTQIPTDVGRYTSPDFPITGGKADAFYLIPPITYSADVSTISGSTTTFALQAKLSDGTYQTVASVTLTQAGVTTGSTDYTVIPRNTSALRYTVTPQRHGADNERITTNLEMVLTPLPIY